MLEENTAASMSDAEAIGSSTEATMAEGQNESRPLSQDGSPDPRDIRIGQLEAFVAQLTGNERVRQALAQQIQEEEQIKAAEAVELQRYDAAVAAMNETTSPAKRLKIMKDVFRQEIIAELPNHIRSELGQITEPLRLEQIILSTPELADVHDPASVATMIDLYRRGMSQEDTVRRVRQIKAARMDAAAGTAKKSSSGPRQRTGGVTGPGDYMESADGGGGSGDIRDDKALTKDIKDTWDFILG
jgi:hypothetical protein